MIAIVDVYDALTPKRNYKNALETAHAIKQLMFLKEKFNQTLVQQFI